MGAQILWVQGVCHAQLSIIQYEELILLSLQPKTKQPSQFQNPKPIKI